MGAVGLVGDGASGVGVEGPVPPVESVPEPPPPHAANTDKAKTLMAKTDDLKITG